MSKPSNPPLFTATANKTIDAAVYSTHISLRDIFAAFCAAGMLADSNVTGSTTPEELAGYAYGNADALLAQREADDAPD